MAAYKIFGFWLPENSWVAKPNKFNWALDLGHTLPKQIGYQKPNAFIRAKIAQRMMVSSQPVYFIWVICTQLKKLGFSTLIPKLFTQKKFPILFAVQK